MVRRRGWSFAGERVATGARVARGWKNPRFRSWIIERGTMRPAVGRVHCVALDRV
jgi:hypothetical protein